MCVGEVDGDVCEWVCVSLCVRVQMTCERVICLYACKYYIGTFDFDQNPEIFSTSPSLADYKGYKKCVLNNEKFQIIFFELILIDIARIND